MTAQRPDPPGPPADGDAFGSDVVDRVRAAGGVWALPGGELRMPRVFGFCRGVTRALSMLQEAVAADREDPGHLYLLGEIIHNPWVNAYVQQRGVRILTGESLANPETVLTARDVAVIPGFGVPLQIQRHLETIGCRIVDTSCGDVRRLWAWATRAVGDGYGIVIFGRDAHDETIVTKSRLESAGGRYVVVGDLDQTRRLCELIATDAGSGAFGRAFTPPATNARSAAPFARIAQVSQTTMLYDQTLEVRRLLHEALVARYGAAEADERLIFEPTVCRATQNRQASAIDLCRSGVDLVVVVGGYGSSNTRHLFELAAQHTPAWFIEDADSIRSAEEILALDAATNKPAIARDWLPAKRPVRIGVLAGASSPEVVVGQVLQRLAELLG